MFKRSLFSLVSQFIIFISGIGVAILTSRFLGPSGRGSYFLIILVATTIFAVLKSNIESATVYFVNSQKIKAKDIVWSLLMLGLAVGAIGGVIIFLVLTAFSWKALSEVPTHLLLIGLFSLPFNLGTLYLSGALWSVDKVRKINILQALQPFANVIGLAALIPALHLGLEGAIIAYSASHFITFLVSLIMVRREFGPFNPSISFPALKQLYSYGLKLQVGEILDFFINRIDSYAIGYFAGSAAVGYYSVSVNAEIIWLLPMAVGYVILPTVSSLVHQESARFTQKACRVVLSISFLLAIFGALISRPVISTIFGNEFLPAYKPLLILLPGITALSISKMLKSYLVGKNHPWIPTISSAIAIVIDLVLIFLLVPRYGIIGAAISTSIAYVIYATAVLAFFSKVTNLAWYDSLFIAKEDIKFFWEAFKNKYKSGTELEPNYEK